MEEILEGLLKWRQVSKDREYEKYFRFMCFSLKWQKITHNPKKTIEYLKSFKEATHTGQDVSVSLVNLLTTSSREVKEELLEAIQPILNRNTTGLSSKEINEAEKRALELTQQSIIEQGLLDFQYRIW